MNYGPLDSALARYNVFPSTKAEIVAAYQEKYPGLGHNGWKQHLVHDLLPFTPQTGKNPAKNLEKRFDSGPKGRLNNTESRNKAQYEALGKTLDPLYKNAPANGITITIDFRESTTNRRQADRSTPALHMDYQTATQYMNQARPDYTFLFDLWGDKKIGTNVFGEDGPYPADILDVIAS